MTCKIAQQKVHGRKRLRVAAVQMKFAPTIDENMVKIERLVGEAARGKADAVLLPECATTGYAYDFSRLTRAEVRNALTAVGAMAARFRVNVLAGSPVFRRWKLYNCLVVFDRQGAATHCYAKCHLTETDRGHFSPGNAVALFEIDGVCATTVICHERRYPELVRLAVMAGARILFHPNAGLDSPTVSRQKRGGRDGVVARAFENAIYYVFANSVGRQAGGKWSAGDSKIVGPDEKVLALADNSSEEVIKANLDLAKATGVYARRGLTRPQFLAPHWKRMVAAARSEAAKSTLAYDLPSAARCSAGDENRDRL
jgi:predicted amidohydrolase